MSESKTDSKFPVQMIVIRENMYKKITRILKYVFNYCERQEHEFNEISSVKIDLSDNEEQTVGFIQSMSSFSFII